MFEDLRRELRHLSGTHTVSCEMPSDDDGYFDRECPSPECSFLFKVHEDDWGDKVRDQEVFCPFCGHTAESDSWWTQQQFKHAQQAAVAQIEDRISGAIKRDAHRWNRRQPKSNFISTTMKVNSRPQHVRLPPAAAQLMELKIACRECACRYAVIGTAYFCPACGHNAADQMFEQSIRAIQQSLANVDVITDAMLDRDTAENTKRLIIEHGLQSAVTAFQRYAENLYGGLHSLAQPRRNAFQNLKEGSDLWHAVTGHRYNDYLDDNELQTLHKYFQQRHLLAHRQGLVDTDYLTKTGDKAYREGQRVVIKGNAVRNCLNLIEKLASAMMAQCTFTNFE